MMAKLSSLGAVIFLTYAILCFLHSASPEEMSDEQEGFGNPVPGEEMPLECSDLAECQTPNRVGRRKTEDRLFRRGIQCNPKDKNNARCKVFLGRKRAVRRTLTSRNNIENPLIRAFSSKFCTKNNPLCRGPAGKKKFAVKKTASKTFPKWKTGIETYDVGRQPCDPSDASCFGKRSVDLDAAEIYCTELDMLKRPECRWPPGKR